MMRLSRKVLSQPKPLMTIGMICLGLVATLSLTAVAQFGNRQNRADALAQERILLAPRPLTRLLREGKTAIEEMRYSDGIEALGSLLLSEQRDELDAESLQQDYFTERLAIAISEIACAPKRCVCWEICPRRDASTWKSSTEWLPGKSCKPQWRRAISTLLVSQPQVLSHRSWLRCQCLTCPRQIDSRLPIAAAGNSATLERFSRGPQTFWGSAYQRSCRRVDASRAFRLGRSKPCRMEPVILLVPRCY